MGNCARRPLHVSHRQALSPHHSEIDNLNALRGDGDIARDNNLPVTAVPPIADVRPNTTTTGNEDLPVRNRREELHVHVAPPSLSKTDSLYTNCPQSLPTSLQLSGGNLAAAPDGNSVDPAGPVIQFLPIVSDGTSYDSAAGGAAPHITFPSTPSRASSRRHRRASSITAPSRGGVNEGLLPLTSQRSNSEISQRHFHSPESSANANMNEVHQVAVNTQQLFDGTASRSARQQGGEAEAGQQAFLPVGQQRSESTVSGMRASRSSAAATTTTATSSQSDEASQAFEKSDVSLSK